MVQCYFISPLLRHAYKWLNDTFEKYAISVHLMRIRRLVDIYGVPFLRPSLQVARIPSDAGGKNRFRDCLEQWRPLFAIGGQTGPNKSTQTVEMLSCSTVDTEPLANGTWAPLPNPRQSHSVALIAGKVVVVGRIAECGVEYFNLPTDNIWWQYIWICRIKGV